VRILYIEDDLASVRVMQRISKHLGHDLIIAYNGQEAQAALQGDIDLILTDVDLPDIDGLTLVSTIRAALPKTIIVAITAHAMADDRDKCLAAGCNEYISKPFDFPEIAALIEGYIQQ
jgi:two-component system, cell cycle response regulator DivK